LMQIGREGPNLKDKLLALAGNRISSLHPKCP